MKLAVKSYSRISIFSIGQSPKLSCGTFYYDNSHIHISICVCVGEGVRRGGRGGRLWIGGSYSLIVTIGQLADMPDTFLDPIPVLGYYHRV